MSLINIHIEKCGGTSIRKELEQHIVSTDRYHMYGDWDYHIDILKNGSRKYRLIDGHFNYGIHEQIDYPAIYTTQMRNPIDRFISHYCHWAERAHSNHNYDYVNQYCANMSDFLDDRISSTIHNFQIRRIAGIVSAREADNKDYQKALDNLKTFKIITFLEDNKHANKMWSEYLGTDFRIGHHNKRKPRGAITNDEFHRIKEVNAMDIALYKEAMSIFK